MSSGQPEYYPAQFDTADCCDNSGTLAKSAPRSCYMDENKTGHIEARVEDRIILQLQSKKKCGKGYRVFIPMRIQVFTSCTCAYPYISNKVNPPPQQTPDS